MDKEKDEIEQLLNEYNQQKEAHEKAFEPLAAPVKSEGQQQNEGKSNKEKKKKRQKKPVDKEKIQKTLKKVLFILAAAFITVGIVFGVIGIVHAAKSAYLRPYKAKYPGVDFPVGIEERFCDYYGQNPNTVGFIEISDLGYSDYILSNNNGSNPVLDRANSRTEPDFNTVVYITSKLVDLESQYASGKSYLSSEQKIKYSTLYEDYEFNIIGAFYTNKNPKDDSGYCFPYNLTQQMTDKSLDAYTDRLYHRFLYNTDYSITNKDKLITLCAESDFMPDFRFVVVGVLNGEKITDAEDNKNVHYPQVWYDKNGAENTYRFASQWYPEIIVTDENGTESTSIQSQGEFTSF